MIARARSVCVVAVKRGPISGRACAHTNTQIGSHAMCFCMHKRRVCMAVCAGAIQPVSSEPRTAHDADYMIISP